MYNTGEYSKTHKICECFNDVVQCLNEIDKSPFMAIDTETTGLDPYTKHIIGYVFGTPDMGCYVPVRHIDNPIKDEELEDTFELIKDYLEIHGIEKVFFNAKFDLKFLKRDGINVRGPIQDTMALFALSAKPTTNNSQALKDICREVLGFKTTGLDILNREKRGKQHLVDKYGYAFFSYETLGFYACEDGLMTARLWVWLNDNMEQLWLTKTNLKKLESPS